mmetsp:Transcript_31184/g.87438  ORF Transcript_31184/g.87438 Transcript_31184/m.87438 type:complete len:272 (+) Transcript_31184:103-918(+)
MVRFVEHTQHPALRSQPHDRAEHPGVEGGLRHEPLSPPPALGDGVVCTFHPHPLVLLHGGPVAVVPGQQLPQYVGVGDGHVGALPDKRRDGVGSVSDEDGPVPVPGFDRLQIVDRGVADALRGGCPDGLLDPRQLGPRGGGQDLLLSCAGGRGLLLGRPAPPRARRRHLPRVHDEPHVLPVVLQGVQRSTHPGPQRPLGATQRPISATGVLREQPLHVRGVQRAPPRHTSRRDRLGGRSRHVRPRLAPDSLRADHDVARHPLARRQVHPHA